MTPPPSPDVPDVPGELAFRDVLGRFASGVTVVAAVVDGRPVGLTCQSFTSVSLHPPLVLFVPSETSRSWPLIERAGAFCVNLLAAEQAAVADRMATRGSDKFAGLTWRPTPGTGSPMLDDTLGAVDCTVAAVQAAGDHHVVVGRVVGLHPGRDGDPLVRYRSTYRGLAAAVPDPSTP